MKFCKDCRYFYTHNSLEENAGCLKSPLPVFQEPEWQNHEPVFGHPALATCLSTRIDRNKCGLDAKWFEPKPANTALNEPKNDYFWCGLSRCDDGRSWICHAQNPQTLLIDALQKGATNIALVREQLVSYYANLPRPETELPKP